MPVADSPPPPPSLFPPLFWWLVAGSVALALIPTAFPALDFAVAGLFSGGEAPIRAVRWPWVEWINLYIPTVFRWLVLAAALVWLLARWRPRWQRWRRPAAFIGLAIALGPGLVVNEVFKEHWHRARPYEVQQFGGSLQFSRAAVISDQCYNNCAFVSGHVACGFVLCSFMLVQRRRQRAWAALGLTAGGLIGFARMADSAHWLSDVLWACPITLLCSALVWRLLHWRGESVPQATPG